jgi:hypothetical protein
VREYHITRAGRARLEAERTKYNRWSRAIAAVFDTP